MAPKLGLRLRTLLKSVIGGVLVIGGSSVLDGAFLSATRLVDIV